MESEALACRIGAGLSTSHSARKAATEAAGAARGGDQDAVDLAFLFLSQMHLNEVEAAADAVREELSPRHLLGCDAEGVVAGKRELEQGPAVAVWAGALPEAEIESFQCRRRTGSRWRALPSSTTPGSRSRPRPTLHPRVVE